MISERSQFENITWNVVARVIDGCGLFVFWQVAGRHEQRERYKNDDEKRMNDAVHSWCGRSRAALCEYSFV